MRAKPLFHEQTHANLLRFAEHMSHAAGFCGHEGVGLKTAATYAAEQAGATTQIVYPEKKDVVDIENGSITIDIVRRLYTMTQGKSKQQRVIIVDAADTMSHEAQNAFLKLLEEPTAHTTFLLLIHRPDRLLPTVLSRLQMLRVQNITNEQSRLLLDRLSITDNVHREQLLFIAGGLPARLTQLAANTKLFEAEAGLLRQARTFIQGSPYERLLVAHATKGNRDDAQKIVAYAIEIMRYDITTKKTATPDAINLLNRLERAWVLLAGNGNARLVLSNVVLAT